MNIYMKGKYIYEYIYSLKNNPMYYIHLIVHFLGFLLHSFKMFTLMFTENLEMKYHLQISSKSSEQLASSH